MSTVISQNILSSYDQTLLK